MFRRVAYNRTFLTLGTLATICAAAISRPHGPAPVNVVGPVRVDAFGDPLPADAVARLGTARFRHGEIISEIAWSPDAKAIYAQAQDGTGVRVWEVATGRELRRIGDGAISAFALTRDGQRLVAGAEFGSLRLWTSQTGKEELPPLSPGATIPDDRVRRENESIKPIQLSADGRIAASLHSHPNAIEVWDIAARRLRAHILSEADHPFTTFCISKDGKTILASTHTGDLKLFDGADGKAIATLHGHAQRASAIVQDGHGKAASAGIDKTLRGWGIAARKELFAVNLQAVPFALTLSPDEKSIAIAYFDPEAADMNLEIRSFQDGRLLKTFAEVPAPTLALAFSPDGSHLAVGGNNTIVILSVATGRDTRPAIGHPGPLTTLALSPDGSKVATCSVRHGTALMWDANTGREIRRFADHLASVDEVQFSPDGKLLATGSWQHPVFLWDMATGRLVHRLDEHPSIGPHFRFSADGKTIATASHANVVGIWDCRTGQRLAEHPAPGHGVASILSYVDGKLLVLEEPDPENENEVIPICIWNVLTERLVRRFAGHRETVNSVVLSNDCRMLASRGEDKFIRVWEVASGEERRAFADPDESTRWVGTQFLSFAPDGRMLATCGSANSSAKLWDLAGNRELAALRGHSSWIGALEFSPDGKRLVTGSQDTTALVWDVGGRLPAHVTAKLTADELKTLWEQLGVTDGVKAYEAIVRLADGVDSAVDFLRDRLKSNAIASREQISKWIDQLDHPQFAVRERATTALAQVAGQAEEQLREAEKKGSAEVRRRVRRIQDVRHDVGASTDRLRELRAMEVIELIATPAARQLLQDLAGGPTGAFLTREAQVAIQRLQRRTGS